MPADQGRFDFDGLRNITLFCCPPKRKAAASRTRRLVELRVGRVAP